MYDYHVVMIKVNFIIEPKFWKLKSCSEAEAAVSHL